MINRNSRVTVVRATTSEDDFGIITASGQTTVATFWAKVKGMSSVTSTAPLNANRKYSSQRVKIIARTDDISGIDIDDELTIAGNDTIWQVNEFYEVDYTTGNINYSEIIAEENN